MMHCTRCNRLLMSADIEMCYLCEITKEGEEIYAIVEDERILMWSNIETGFDSFPNKYEVKTFSPEEFERTILMQE